MNSNLSFRDPAFSANRDTPIHRWVPWIAGFSKHFIEDAIGSYANGYQETILDPFAGVGTALIESDLAGHNAVGFEINPYAAFAAKLKLSAHRIPTESVRAVTREFQTYMATAEKSGALPESTPPDGFRTRGPFFSLQVEKKVLLMLDFISKCQAPLVDMLRLAFASTMVEYSNYSYEPSLGRRTAAGRSNVDDHEVATHVAGKLNQMADDADWYRQGRKRSGRSDGKVYVESFFDAYKRIVPGSVDLIVTSPPYANNYHYVRNTRPHLYWLGFCRSPDESRQLEDQNFGTYWQRARRRESISLHPSITDPEIRSTLADIRGQNANRGIYGGPGWANYITTYLNDCVRFVVGMDWCLRSGATALIVIGNSIVQGVPVPTDRFLAKIAHRHGLTVAGIHTPRPTRVGNSITKSNIRFGNNESARLYESVVELRKP